PWMLPGDCESRIDVIDSQPELVVTASAGLDPRSALFGNPLDETSWDVTARNELLGTINQRGLRTSTPARSAVQDGHVYIAYRNLSGMLSFDVDETYRSLAGSAKLDVGRVRSTAPRSSRSRWKLGARTFQLTFE